MNYSVHLPLNWKEVRLGECCSVQNGYPFKSELFDESNGIPLIRVRSLKTQSCDVYYKGDYDDSYLISNGDVLIGMDGDFQPCFWQGGKSLLNQRVCRLISFKRMVDPYYVFQAIKRPLKEIENSTYYTTVKHLSSFKIQEIPLSLPPYPQQLAISKVLQTLQDAIQTRRDELNLERERKAALMEHLFTHGTRGETAKQTEFGYIPQSWELVHLGKLVLTISA